MELADPHDLLPFQTDGLSLAPTLLRRNDQRQHESLYWEYHSQGGRQALRMGNWKGVRYNVAQNPHRPISLYNLTTDPGERHDVSDNNLDIATAITRRMSEARVDHAAWQWGRQPASRAIRP
jgi:arylsulfatase A-like enzyme